MSIATKGRPQLMEYHGVIDALLREHELTIDEFSRKADIAYKTAHGIAVNGIDNIGGQTLRKCAAAFGMRRSEFVKLFDDWDEQQRSQA